MLCSFFLSTILFTLIFEDILFLLTSQIINFPVDSSLLIDADITLYLTVANCGLELGVIIWAIIFPPKAGLICIKSVFSFISKTVQSAVKPVLYLAANDLPTVVAPTNITDGLTSSIKLSNIAVYGSILKLFRLSSSYTYTLSTP